MVRLVVMVSVVMVLELIPSVTCCSCYTCSNVALGRPAKLSSLYDACTGTTVHSCRTGARATDGNRGTQDPAGDCIHSGQQTNPWLGLDLGDNTTVDHAVIYNRQDGNTVELANFKIIVGDIGPDVFNFATHESQMQLCYHHPGAAELGVVYNLTCTAEARGRYVYLINERVDTHLTIGELEIYPKQTGTLCLCDINIAVGRPGYMSSIQNDAAGYAPYRALDGEKGPHMIHTGPEALPWLGVDFGNPFPVHRVVIYNRQSSVLTTERLRDFDVRVGEIEPEVFNPTTNYGSQMALCLHHPGKAEFKQTFNRQCNGKPRGRYAYLVTNVGGTGTVHINIYEFEVYTLKTVSIIDDAGLSDLDVLTDSDLTTCTPMFDNKLRRPQTSISLSCTAKFVEHTVIWFKGISECPTGRHVPISIPQQGGAATIDSCDSQLYRMCPLTSSTQDGALLACQYQCEGGDPDLDNPILQLSLSSLLLSDRSLEIYMCEIQSVPIAVCP